MEEQAGPLLAVLRRLNEERVAAALTRLLAQLEAPAVRAVAPGGTGTHTGGSSWQGEGQLGKQGQEEGAQTSAMGSSEIICLMFEVSCGCSVWLF